MICKENAINTAQRKRNKDCVCKVAKICYGFKKANFNFEK